MSCKYLLSRCEAACEKGVLSVFVLHLRRKGAFVVPYYFIRHLVGMSYTRQAGWDLLQTNILTLHLRLCENKIGII